MNALVSKGHYVISAIGYAAPSHKPTIIKRALRRDFAHALQESMGMDAERAEQEARACGASVSVWSVWNRLEGNALGNLPSWCDATHLSRTLPAVLASGWDERAQEDREILQALSGVDYDIFVQGVCEHMRSDPPFVERVDSVLSVVAPTVAFALSAKRIPQALLRTLEKCIETVFAQMDPDIVSGWDGSLKYPTSAMVQDHSDWLREGLLETILRISAFKEVLDSQHVAYEYGGCQAFVDRVVEKIARFRDEPRFFAALSSNLPTMAEAAPIPFVEALEQALQGYSSALKPLFEDKGFFGPILHTGLLASLECLAWEPSYLARVATLLARLVQFEDDGKVINRPSNSLRAIFLAWSPGTSATLSQRLDVLRLLANEYPSVAWKLACAILPKAYDTHFSSREPVWKDFGRSTRLPLNDAAIREALFAYVTFALEMSNGDTVRQLNLVESYPMFALEHRDILRQQLTETANDPLLPSATKDAIWNEIRQLVGKHRRFSNAVWAMPANEVDSLEEVGRGFQSKSAVDEVQWLFDEYLPDLPDVDTDVSAALERANALRDQALRKVMNGGVGSVDDLFGKVRQPHLVAQQAAASMDDTEQLLTLIDRWFERRSARDLRGIPVLCASRSNIAGDIWTMELLKAATSRKWPDWALGLCLADFADSRALLETLDKVSPAAVTRYWETRSPYLRSSDQELNDRIATEFVAHGRGLDLVNQSIKLLSSAVAMNVMKAAVADLSEQSKLIPLLGYNVKEAISWLKEQDGVLHGEIEDIELRCLPVLLAELRDGEQLSFHRTMAERPDAFIDVICVAYAPAKSVNEQQAPDGVSSSDQARAIVAWRVLRAWRTPPGLSQSGVMREGPLMEWILKARKLAEELDRTAVADQYIGAVLLHTPAEKDGRWPGDAVAGVLEKLGSRDIESGLAMEVVNSRGVTTRGVFDGGEQEHALSGEWLLRARILPERWQRAKQLCRRIATSWKQMADELDVQAAKRRIGR
ncbi:hypothetical protein ACOCG7_00910 [Paraburkholderia sp. DD10]|uniref:hypothetical protein n=1 Tax=Paraburkholderia sp. DD10 TaxID=3409691 RepID=UPI003BA01D19